MTNCFGCILIKNVLTTHCVFCTLRNGTAGTTWHRASPPEPTNHRAAAPLPLPPPSNHQAIPSGVKPPTPKQRGLPPDLLPAAWQQPPPARGNVPAIGVPGRAQWPLHDATRSPVPGQPRGPGGGPSTCHPAHAERHHEPPAPQPEQERRGCYGLQAQPRWKPVSSGAGERAWGESPQPPPSDTNDPAAAAAAATAASTAAAGGGALQEPCHHARFSSRGAANTHRTDSR